MIAGYLGSEWISCLFRLQASVLVSFSSLVNIFHKCSHRYVDDAFIGLNVDGAFIELNVDDDLKTEN